jgi:hypothetical protein
MRFRDGRLLISPDALALSAIAHVKSWRLEESAQETPFNVTFDFGVTDDLSDLSMDLSKFPRRVVLHANPEVNGKFELTLSF